ncbi:MAG: hypothetical protein ACYCQI_14630 [Gammaproteobacteria bacterium]
MFGQFKEKLWYYFMGVMLRNPDAFADADVYYFVQFLIAMENTQDLASFKKVISQYLCARELKGFDLSEMSPKDKAVFNAVISVLRVSQDESKSIDKRKEDRKLICKQVLHCVDSGEIEICRGMDQFLFDVSDAKLTTASVVTRISSSLEKKDENKEMNKLFGTFVEYLESLLKCMRSSRNLLAYEFCPIFSPRKDQNYVDVLMATQNKIFQMVEFIENVKKCGSFQNIAKLASGSFDNEWTFNGAGFGLDWMSPAVVYALSFVVNPGDDKGFLRLSHDRKNRGIPEIFNKCRTHGMDYGKIGEKHHISIDTIHQYEERFLSQCYSLFNFDPTEIPDRYADTKNDSMFLAVSDSESCFGGYGMFLAESKLEDCVVKSEGEKILAPVSLSRFNTL